MINAEIGPMRNRLAIQSRTTTKDSYGAAVESWSTAATVWGRIEPLSGRELWQAQQVRPDVSHKVTLRAYAGLTPRHRLLFGSRVFEISSVLNIDERGRFMVCVCIEKVT